MNILVLAAPALDRTDIIAALPSSGTPPAIVDSSADASARLAQGGIDLVVLDLAADDALRFLRKLPAQAGRAPVVCVADRRQPDASSEALRLGVVDIIGRPVTASKLAAAISNTRELERVAQIPPVQAAASGVGPLFTASPAMRDVLGIARRVAHSRSGVLIVGERGTGRETVARTIHKLGPRHHEPFTKVLCAEVSPEGLDAILNVDEGAGGTVFLDDICDLPAELQLRIELAHRSPVRLIASAVSRVDGMLEKGTLRRGFIEQLAVVRIDIPPLRQRAQDIPILALTFLKEACERNGIPPKTFSRGALTLLAALPWRGNAQELRSVTERLAVVVPRGVVLLEDVLANVRLDGSESLGRARGTLKDAREQFEKDYVTAVLEQHKGRMGVAAQELGIERTNLYRKIKQLKIRWNHEG